MLTYDDNQKATKAHCRLAFSAQPQRFFLPLLVGLHGSTDTTARKSAIEEKMFWKVTLPSTKSIFSAKDVCTINFTVSFYLYLYLQPRENCFFFRRWVTWSWHNTWSWHIFRDEFMRWICQVKESFTLNLSFLLQVYLRWLDWIFLGGYLPSLSINYVGMSKDMGKMKPRS